jgi:predicted alpha/beta hydrolase
MAKYTALLPLGICDSPYAWIANGSADSLSYRARDEGFDVFMPSFRGVYPRASSGGKYNWDYCLDHLADYDIPATLAEIKKIKASESNDSDHPPPTRYIYVAHSMGGIAIIKYLERNQQSHGISSVSQEASCRSSCCLRQGFTNRLG